MKLYGIFELMNVTEFDTIKKNNEWVIQAIKTENPDNSWLYDFLMDFTGDPSVVIRAMVNNHDVYFVISDKYTFNVYLVSELYYVGDEYNNTVLSAPFIYTDEHAIYDIAFNDRDTWLRYSTGKIEDWNETE